ncbi:hypothetical protein, partial [Microlunatus antarcticus]|uniref:hypothetical protein n=1 Tax=Microlunatus antarcticus TaxID=53388 RepID=UPI0018E07E28
LTTAIGVAVVRAGRVQPVPVGAGAGTGDDTALVPSERRKRSLLPRKTSAVIPPALPDVTTPVPDGDTDTTILPAVRGLGDSPSADPVPTKDPVAEVVSDATERPSKRRWRKHEDDFGDFSDLRDPDEPSPRRSR